MNKYKTVSEFLDDLDADKREQVDSVRKLILAAEPGLTEDIKWNAPNFIYNNEDRITFNLLNKEGKVKLILHMGASKKEDKKAAPVLQGYDNLVDWSSNIRGIITFDSASDISAKQTELTKVIKAWLALG